MLNRAFKASLLGLVATIALIGTKADAAPRTSLDNYPVSTIGDLEELSADSASYYVRGMLQTSAIITALQLEDIDAARCIAAQDGQVLGTLNAGLDKGLEMPLTGVIATIQCMEGDLAGDADLISASDYDRWLGSGADSDKRALFLMGARDFLLQHLKVDSTEAELVCVSDAAVSGLDPKSAFSRNIEIADDTLLIIPVIKEMMSGCF